MQAKRLYLFFASFYEHGWLKRIDSQKSIWERASGKSWKMESSMLNTKSQCLNAFKRNKKYGYTGALLSVGCSANAGFTLCCCRTGICAERWHCHQSLYPRFPSIIGGYRPRLVPSKAEPSLYLIYGMRLHVLPPICNNRQV